MKRIFFTVIVFTSLFLSLASCNLNMQESRGRISVLGTGTVLAQPDMARINIGFSYTKSTVSEAKTAAEQTLQRILGILRQENVEDKFVKTVDLNFDTEYEYRNRRRYRIGQRVQQTILVTINDMVKSPERLSSALNKITAIDNVEVHNISFDIENKTELFKRSRELAYQKALDKARQYAELSNRRLGKVLSVSEVKSRDFIQNRAVQNLAANMELKAEVTEDTFDVILPTGEQGISTEINVIFSLD